MGAVHDNRDGPFPGSLPLKGLSELNRLFKLMDMSGSSRHSWHAQQNRSRLPHKRPGLPALEGPKGRAEEPQGPYYFVYGPRLFLIGLLPYFP